MKEKFLKKVLPIRMLWNKTSINYMDIVTIVGFMGMIPKKGF